MSGNSGLNATPSSERVHIGLFGRRNAGKSSLINVLTGQSLAIVSDTPGTTTDPVSKAMELLPLGPSCSSTRRASTTKGNWAACGSSGPIKS